MKLATFVRSVIKGDFVKPTNKENNMFVNKRNIVVIFLVLAVVVSPMGATRAHASNQRVTPQEVIALLSAIYGLGSVTYSWTCSVYLDNIEKISVPVPAVKIKNPDVLVGPLTSSPWSLNIIPRTYTVPLKPITLKGFSYVEYDHGLVQAQVLTDNFSKKFKSITNIDLMNRSVNVTPSISYWTNSLVRISSHSTYSFVRYTFDVKQKCLFKTKILVEKQYIQGPASVNLYIDSVVKVK